MSSIHAVDNGRTSFITQGHIPWLDGLRGIAAIWVLFSHVQILSGMRAVPLLSWGALAVDLFMMLSGFLMTFHYVLRRDAEPWTSSSTWMTFWIRRFFRIAPLYYLLLAAAFLVGPVLGEYRHDIAQLWPATATSAGRYYDQSLDNLFMHLSFAFGFFPQYAYKTALPDWSIGLEMQFYLAFPFLMLAVKYLGILRAGLAAITLCAGGLYYYADFFRQFEMPAFLPIKLYMFFIGMWVALSWQKKSMKGTLLISVAIMTALCLFQRTFESGGRIAMVIAMFYLMNNGTLPTFPVLDKSIAKIRQLFSGSIATFLGETSYSVYLLHLLILLPVAGILSHYAWYVNAAAIVRFGICSLLTAPIAYFLGWLLYKTVEKSGIRIGKWTIKRFKQAGLIATNSNLVTASQTK